MATQKELAVRAGVSAGTVSNVISGTKPVAEKSRQKVLEAIRALNSKPNLIARSLKTNRTNTIGLIVPDITISFYTNIIRSAELAARAQGYFLIVLDSQHSHELEVQLLGLLHQRVDGILFVTAGDYEWSDDGLRQIVAGLPVVCVDRRPERLNVDSVGVDDKGAAQIGVRHLIEKGHNIIAVVTGPLSLANECERLDGYRSALRHARLGFQKHLIWSADFDQESIDTACRKGLLQSTHRPSAIFSTNAVTALRALRSLYHMGLITPRDFAFATIDEVMIDAPFGPTITSVVQPTHEIGRLATELLIKRIESAPKRARSHSPSTIRLPATLVVRDSSQ